jgi:hypothetical protein
MTAFESVAASSEWPIVGQRSSKPLISRCHNRSVVTPAAAWALTEARACHASVEGGQRMMRTAALDASPTSPQPIGSSPPVETCSKRTDKSRSTATCANRIKPRQK